MVSVIESACEGDLIQISLCLFKPKTTWHTYKGFCILLKQKNLAYLALMEVITLPHLDAVKDVVTSIDHSFSIFVFIWTT